MRGHLEVISSVTQFAPKGSNDGPIALIDAARRAEANGVDSLLIGYASTGADGWTLASYLLSSTTSMRVLLAHRPGIVSPILAGRMATTLDVLSGGRFSFNIVAGGSIGEQMREGDFLEHDARYARSIEYVDLLKRIWLEPSPFDHEGEFYRVVRAFSQLKPCQKPHPPIYMGGASEAAKDFALAHADVYMSWSEPVDMVAERFTAIRALTNSAGRSTPRFSVSMRLIMGDTEDEAWATAEAMLPDDLEERRKREFHREDSGRNRQLSLAKDSLVHDERLWMGLAAATGGLGSTGALVGTPEQVQRALLRYVAEGGADTLLLTGPDGAYADFPDGFLDELRAQADAIIAKRTVQERALGGVG